MLVAVLGRATLRSARLAIPLTELLRIVVTNWPPGLLDVKVSSSDLYRHCGFETGELLIEG
jgi:hypothetical protein